MSISVELMFKQVAKLQDCAECFSFIMHHPSVLYCTSCQVATESLSCLCETRGCLQNQVPVLQLTAGSEKWGLGESRALLGGKWEPAHLLLSVAGLRYWSAPGLNHGTTCRVHLFSVWNGGRMESFVRGWEKFLNTETRQSGYGSVLYVGTVLGYPLCWRRRLY